ncbi:MAG: bifunctional ADP-heptose synthase [Anaerolineae bacterium]
MTNFPTERLIYLATHLAGWQVMVIGDVILDEYLIGSTSRLSREAPIPVLEFERREVIPGGAANPSANIAALGSRALQVSVVGADDNAETLRVLLRRSGIDPSGVITDPTRPTTTKTRIMAQMGLRFPQQVARIDRLSREAVGEATQNALLGAIQVGLARQQAIIISDYLSGAVSLPLAQQVQAWAATVGILLTADAQGAFEKYSGYDLIKCNADELARHVGKSLHTDAEFAEAGRVLQAELGIRQAIMITRGAEGITVITRDQSAHIAAPQIEDVYDTVGAGDTVIAVVTLALLAGASPSEAAALATYAAGIVIRKVGNYAPNRNELIAALQADGA